MPMPSDKSHRYLTVSDLNDEHYTTPWYWRLIALLASWMVLGGYLIVPPLFHADAEAELRCRPNILTVFVVGLLVAGYSSTVLLCFVCQSMIFQSESIFLPSLASSALGLLTVLYNWLAYTNFEWNSTAVVATSVSGGATLIYGILLINTNHRIARLRQQLASRSNNPWQQGSSYYENWISNMFPSVKRVSPMYTPPPDQYTPGFGPPLTEDDMVNQQMAMLLMKSDSGPSPNAGQTTFQITLPQNEESDGENSPNARRTRTLLRRDGPPGPAHPQLMRMGYFGRTRSGSENLQPQQDVRRGRTDIRSDGEQVRAKSREERRQEIELGRVLQYS